MKSLKENCDFFNTKFRIVA